MKNKTAHYDPFGNGGWNYGQRFNRSTRPYDYGRYLGPCPLCGNPCFEYGGGARCTSPECFNSYLNISPSLSVKADWWNTNIQVVKDGNMWRANYEDKESITAFGETPQKAIDNLKALDKN
jgi:hypothetical protein